MHTRHAVNSKSLLAAAVSAVLLASAPAVAGDSGRSFEICGFAQANFIQDVDGRLDPDWDDAIQDIAAELGVGVFGPNPK